MVLIGEVLFWYGDSVYSDSYFGIGHFLYCCPFLGFLCLFFCLEPLAQLKGHKLNKPGLGGVSVSRVRECTTVWVNQTHLYCYLVMCPRANALKLGAVNHLLRTSYTCIISNAHC